MATKTKSVVEGRAAVIRHLESIAKMSAADLESISNLSSSMVERSAGEELQAPGTLLCESRFLLSGWICRCITLPDGRRQILDFYIPGDLVGYCSRPTARAKASYVCLTSVIAVDAAHLVARTQADALQYPGLTAAWLAIENEIEQRLLDQIVRNGRMPAHERILDLIKDLDGRHRRAGIGFADGFVMPLTQETLGEALGLSTVHINRVLQQMRREQIVRTSLGKIEIVNRRLLDASRFE